MTGDDASPETERPESLGCYRHPYEEAGVRCIRCERPICPSCMITAPVGFQCPDCVKGAPPVRRYRDVRAAAERPPVTIALIAVNALVFVASVGGGGSMMRSGNRFAIDWALFGPAVAEGEWYRLVTAGFLHYGLIHVLFNMLILFQLGQLLEPVLGRARFTLLYVAALLGGSVGALILSPNALTAGASGAVFGLMGATAVELRRRGVNVMQTSIGSLLVINLLLTFAIRGVSIVGHIGGLAAGLLAGVLLARTERQSVAGAIAVGALALALLGAGVAVA